MSKKTFKHCPYSVGRHGNINVDGDPKSPAVILSSDHPDFWGAIEPGIRPLVKVLVDKGYVTFSSCEGHVYPDGSYASRHVDFIVERKDLRSVQRNFRQHCKLVPVSLRVFLEFHPMPVPVSGVSDPVRFHMVLGDPRDAALEIKTKSVLKWLECLPLKVFLTEPGI